MMKKILIPVDGSKHSLKAVEYLIELMPLLKETPKVHLLTVQRPITFGNMKKFVKKKSLEEFYEEQAKARMADAHEMLEEASVEHSQHIRIGQVADAIADYVKEKECDQIVMSTRGRGDVPAMLLGSTAHRVVSLVRVAVTLVR